MNTEFCLNTLSDWATRSSVQVARRQLNTATPTSSFCQCYGFIADIVFVSRSIYSNWNLVKVITWVYLYIMLYNTSFHIYTYLYIYIWIAIDNFNRLLQTMRILTACAKECMSFHKAIVLITQRTQFYHSSTCYPYFASLRYLSIYPDVLHIK